MLKSVLSMALTLAVSTSFADGLQTGCEPIVYDKAVAEHLQASTILSSMNVVRAKYCVGGIPLKEACSSLKYSAQKLVSRSLNEFKLGYATEDQVLKAFAEKQDVEASCN